MKSFAALLVVAMFPSAVSADGSDEKRENFKRKMAPKIGQVLTVSGVVADGRHGWYFLTDDGGELYLESPTGEPTRRYEYLKNWNGKRFTIRGTLAYREPGAAPRANPVNRREHFYMDMSKTITIERVDQGR
jgi:hypothetical protein